MTIELLEPRRLLSVSIDHGKLLVSGSSSADRIILQSVDAASILLISLQKFKHIGATTRIPLDSLSRIIIHAGGGDDFISLQGLALPQQIRLIIHGDSGEDTIRGSPHPDTIFGGRGNDLINGDLDRDELDGGRGDDTLMGHFGNDLLFGGAGDDYLSGMNGLDTLIGDDPDRHFAGSTNPFRHGDRGADVFDGGAGEDWVYYGGRGENLRISADGKANDGRAEEGDNVLPNVEDIDGGRGDDHISALFIGEGFLSGGDGDDTLVGGGGQYLSGQFGNDLLIMKGSSKLGGYLDGNEDNDTLISGGAGDNLDGGPGDDLLDASNPLWQDLDGGPGVDRAFVNPGIDSVIRVEQQRDHRGRPV
jgi:Ca2+-binding RTX toxin-like protein